MRIGISVRKALLTGHLMVNLPVIFSILVIPLLTFYFYKKSILPIWSIPVGILVGFVLGWFIWSVMITKWRLWAFQNVRNVHELKRRAIEEKLIWDDGNWFEKTEIRGKQDRLDLKRISRKFDKEDIYRENHSLPIKTRIYYAKIYNPFEFISASLLLILSICLLIFYNGDIKVVVIALLIMLFIMEDIIKALKKILKKEPMIEVDSLGIKTPNVGFKEWSKIEKEEVVKEYFKESKLKVYLVFYYDEGIQEKVELNKLNISYENMVNILKTYRIRNNKKFY